MEMIESKIIDKIGFLVSDACTDKIETAREIIIMIDGLTIHDLGKARLKEDIDIYLDEPTEINKENIMFALEALK